MNKLLASSNFFHNIIVYKLWSCCYW